MFTTINDIRGSLIRVSIDLQYHVVLVSVRAKAEIPCLAAQMHLLFSHVIGYDFSRQYPFRYPYTHIVNKKRRYVQRKFRSYRHIHAWTRTPYRILTYPANLWELGGGGGGGWRGGQYTFLTRKAIRYEYWSGLPCRLRHLMAKVTCTWKLLSEDIYRPWSDRQLSLHYRPRSDALLSYLFYTVCHFTARFQ